MHFDFHPIGVRHRRLQQSSSAGESEKFRRLYLQVRIMEWKSSKLSNGAIWTDTLPKSCILLVQFVLDGKNRLPHETHKYLWETYQTPTGSNLSQQMLNESATYQLFSSWTPSIWPLSVHAVMWAHRSAVHSEDYAKPPTLLKERPDLLHGNPLLNQLSDRSAVPPVRGPLVQTIVAASRNVIQFIFSNNSTFYREVTGSNPVEVLNFSGFFIRNCIKLRS